MRSSTMTATNTNSIGSRHKKSMALPEEVPHHLKLINGTTPEEKTQAQRLFDLIGEGFGHAVSRPKDPAIDRSLRRLVADANSAGDCIINVGFGYYRPGADDFIEFQEYVAKERHRAREILRKVSRMQQVYDRRYQINE